MILNSETLDALNVEIKTEQEKAFNDATETTAELVSVVPEKVDTIVVNGLQQFPAVREWKDEKVINSIKEYNRTVVLKPFEVTIGIPRRALETDQVGIRSADPVLPSVIVSGQTRRDDEDGREVA